MMKTMLPQAQLCGSSSSAAGVCYSSRSPSPAPVCKTENSEQANHHQASPGHTSTLPVISVVRPSRVSGSVNPRVLKHLRRKFEEQAEKTEYRGLLTAGDPEVDSDDIKCCKSAECSPNVGRKLRRSTSFKGVRTKLSRVNSDGIKGYNPLPSYPDDLWFPREKITSVQRALRGKSASLKRPMSLIPATNRIIHFDSSEESDGESDLDFAQLSHWKSEVSKCSYMYVHH